MIKIIWLIATVYFMSRLFRRVFASMKDIRTEGTTAGVNTAGANTTDVKASDVIVDVDAVEPPENN